MDALLTRNWEMKEHKVTMKTAKPSYPKVKFGSDAKYRVR